MACLLTASAVTAQIPQVPPPGPVTSPGPDYVPRELIVRFEPGTTAAERRSLNAAQGASVRRGLLVPRAYLVQLPKDRDVRAGQRAYEGNPNVQYAEPNHIGRLFATPNDPGFPLNWSLHNTGQTVNGIAGTADADIDAPEAWDLTTGSSSVVVGVADTGIAYDHPDLAGNIWLNPGESGGGKETNGLDDDGNGKVDDFRGWDFTENDNDPMDYESHGSHVAGTIGAVGNNGQGVPGVNWNVRVAALRMCSPNPLVGCSAAAAADAFAYAGQKGMKVVNGSFGTAFSQVAADAIAGAPNTLFVFAAGNGGADGVGDDNDAAPVYPCQYPAPNIICVAASDQNDNRASFSNYGDVGVDLAAPGTNILNAYPNGVRFGETFEAPDFGTKWTTGGINNTWARQCASGFCFMTDSPAGNYLNNTNSWSRNTTAFNTTGMTDCHPQWLMNRDIAGDEADSLQFETSTDALTWTIRNGFGGTSSGYAWTDTTLPASLNNVPNVYLRWRLQTNPSVTADGAALSYIYVRCRRSDYSGGQGYGYASGTSMASPHVAGAGALAFARVPGATVAGVKNAILDGVDKKASLSGLVGTGGRLNLANMLARLACCHVRPAGASPLRVSLVPAYTQCTSPNRVHGPPDLPGGTNPDGSCAPPVQRSTQLTVGTPDANGAGANSIGSLKMTTIVGNPGTPADEADVGLVVNITDVRQKTTGLPDYGGQLQAGMTWRLTDRRSGPSTNEAATLNNGSIQWVVPCTTTASTGIGSTCSISTTVDALSPGLVAEGARAVWELGQVELRDGGPDNNINTEPNTVFAVQGVFVP